MTTHYPRRTQPDRQLREGDRVRDLFAVELPFGRNPNYPGAHRFGSLISEAYQPRETDYTGASRKTHPELWVWVRFDDGLVVEVPVSTLVRL